MLSEAPTVSICASLAHASTGVRFAEVRFADVRFSEVRFAQVSSGDLLLD